MALKRILICFVIVGCIVFGLIQYSNMRRDRARQNCLVRFGNVNKVLGLYRADYDGFSPCYNSSELRKGIDKLAKYSDGKPLNCPYVPRLSPLHIRITVGSSVAMSISKMRSFGNFFSPFGVEETSVVASCEEHINHKFRFEIPNSVARTVEQDPATGGVFNILLRNGTAKSIPFNTRREHWISWNGEFKRLEDRPDTWKSYGNTYIFDFEPQFEY